MPLIFRYFWFIGAGVMLVNIAILRFRFRTLIARRVVTEDEVTHFLTWLVVWLVGGPLVLGIVALVAKWPSPFCAGMLAFATPAQTIVSLFTLASWAALLWWVWRGRGANFLARVGPALGNRPNFDKRYSPTSVRVAVTALVLVSSVGSAIMWRTMPMTSEMPELTCPTTPPATMSR